jgi:NADPH:quinone reductase-like Zn-dependent oxidoreductase
VLSALGRGTYNLAPLAFHGGTYSGIFTLLPMLTGKGRAHHGDILREAAKLAEAGKLKPLIEERRFTLETVEEAYQLMDKRVTNGKLVVEIQ